MSRFALVLAAMLAFSAITHAHAQVPLALSDQASVSARGESGRAQLFRFIAFTGDRIELEVRQPGVSSVVVFGPNGESLASDEGEGSRVLRVTAPADGPYFASVAASTDASYTVQLRRVFKAPVVDPVWGAYSSLAGHSFLSDNGYRLQWRWEREGAALVEEWLNAKSDKVTYAHRIEPGAAIGDLRRTDVRNGKVTNFTGRVLADGSLDWTVGGMPAFRIKVEGDGVRHDVLRASGEVRVTALFLPADSSPGK